jgi:hypothetical protein
LTEYDDGDILASICCRFTLRNVYLLRTSHPI